MTTCPNGVWNHARGCGCVPHRPAAAEVDVDLLIHPASSLGEWGLPQVNVEEDGGGTCGECGHYQEPFKPCEVCNPTCPGCGCPTEDGSKCDDCTERDADYEDED